METRLPLSRFSFQKIKLPNCSWCYCFAARVDRQLRFYLDVAFYCDVLATRGVPMPRTATPRHTARCTHPNWDATLIAPRSLSVSYICTHRPALPRN